jgi:hypothetical protein
MEREQSGPGQEKGRIDLPRSLPASSTRISQQAGLWWAGPTLGSLWEVLWLSFLQLINREIGSSSGNGSLMFWKPSLFFLFLWDFPWWARKRSWSLTGSQGWGPGVLPSEMGIYHCDIKPRQDCICGGKVAGWGAGELLSVLRTMSLSGHQASAMTLRSDWLIASSCREWNYSVL